MSTTEAPDVTVASPSPWHCWGIQRKTSLREMDGHKGGIRHGVELKKEGGGKQREGLFKRRERERYGEVGGGQWSQPRIRLFICLFGEGLVSLGSGRLWYAMPSDSDIIIGRRAGVRRATRA